MDDSRSLSFVIPVRNDALRLEDCLRSIARATSTATDTEVIVVDNGSTDGSAATARRLGATVLELPGLRVGELRNRGAAAARGAIIAFIDADHEIADTWVSAARETLADPGIGAVGAAYSPPSQSTWVQRIYDGFRDHPVRAEDVRWLGSGNVAVKHAAFTQVHGFDSSLEACEDVDLCQRLRSAGFRLVADPRLKSTHKGDPSTLRQLFLSELWRGRDNLRVSLRGCSSWSELPSVVIPILDIVCLVGGIIAIATMTRAGARLGAVAGAIFIALAVARATRLVCRLPQRKVRDVAGAVLVSLVYDAARALALTMRVPHRRAKTPRNTISATGL